MSWPVKNIGTICEIFDSKRKPITKKNRVGGPYPYYGATGVLDYVEGYIFNEDLVLIGEDGAKWGAGDNSAFPISGKTWVNNHAHVLKPDRSTIIDAWLIYYLNATDLSSFITGMTVPKLNQGKLKEIPVPTPTLQEQQRIVAILDAAFEQIDQAKAIAQQNLQNAREIFDSAVENIFHNSCKFQEFRPLESIAKIVNGYAFASKDFSPTGGVNVIKITNVGVNDFIVDEQNKLPQEFFERYKDYRADEGDIVIALTRTIISGGLKVAAVPEEYHGALINQRVAAIKVDSDYISSELMQAYLASKMAKKYVKSRVNELMQPNLSIKDLKLFPVPVPKPCNIEAITTNIKALRKFSYELEQIYQQKITALGELKQSLLQQAFSGQLTAKHSDATV